MNDYLVVIKDDPTMPDEDFLWFVELYGFSKRKAELSLLLLRFLGAAPGGSSDYDKALERQAYLKACDIESDIIYTNQPKDGLSTWPDSWGRVNGF